MVLIRSSFLCAVTLSLLPLLNTSSSADDHKFVFTNTKTNRFVGKKTLTERDFAGVSTNQEWSITKEVLKGGKQSGVDLITVDNGRMKIRIIPTRGMNILDMQVDDFRLGWKSPVKEVVHPSYINLDTRGGLGWLDGFNEWMVRCGLEFAGHPGVDKFIDNTGAEAEMNLSLHGKVGNIPASHVEVRIQKEKPHRITIRGTVHERMFFGPKLQLVTEISTLPGSSEVTVTDSVTNNGANDQEMMLIYHTNYGEPLLEAGAKVVAPIRSLAPMNETAIAGLKEYATYGAPQADFLEQVYLTELYADQDDQTLVCLHSKNGERAASISYSVKELPYFTIWKNTTARENGYVTGLEPGTSFPFNRHVERKFGRVPKLAPGETRQFSLTYGVHLGEKTVQSVLSDIEKIQNGRKTAVSEEVPEH